MLRKICIVGCCYQFTGGIILALILWTPMVPWDLHHVFNILWFWLKHKIFLNIICNKIWYIYFCGRMTYNNFDCLAFPLSVIIQSKIRFVQNFCFVWWCMLVYDGFNPVSLCASGVLCVFCNLAQHKIDSLNIKHWHISIVLLGLMTLEFSSKHHNTA